MDFSNPSLLISGFVVSMIGLGLFMHGKRSERVRNLAIGLAMMVFPVFVHSLIVLWVLAGACLASVFLLPEGA